jgi:hypothetical protein
MSSPIDNLRAVAESLGESREHVVFARLRSLGFSEDPDGPVCRWRIAGIKIDFMPPIEAIPGFTNRWYPAALEHADLLTLDGMPSSNRSTLCDCNEARGF